MFGLHTFGWPGLHIGPDGRMTFVEDPKEGWRRGRCPTCGVEYGYNDYTCIVTPECYKHDDPVRLVEIPPEQWS